MRGKLSLVILFALTIAIIGGFLWFWPAIPQPLAYHQFADQRPLFGVPHFGNVVSNLPFLIVGVWGLTFMASARSRRPGAFLESAERWPYWTYFLGLALTAVGSAYYHADPGNFRLVWDRLPLTITFMALFTAILAERLDWRLAAWLLAPLVGLGMASVLYWHWTELYGVGDLRFYLIVQFFPLIALPLLLIFFRPRYTAGGDLIAALACYVLAKILEALDAQVYTQGGIVSGHTLKHLVAGLAAYFVLHMLQHRRPLPARDDSDAQKRKTAPANLADAVADA
jgi:hypothetical protein